MVCNAFVFVHQTLHQANQRMIKRGGRTMCITPRHFLDFIAHYVKLTSEKRSDLEEQQLHLNIGLQKIQQTVEQVEVMQKSLTKKRKELEKMNEAANAKLKEMVQDQQEAEKRKQTSQKLREQLSEQEVFIAEKRTAVMGELSQVEPAVNDAKQGETAKAMPFEPYRKMMRDLGCTKCCNPSFKAQLLDRINVSQKGFKRLGFLIHS